MDIIIRNADGRPIYEQIYAQLKDAILAGELAPGQALPSIRQLAKDLRISVITTTRAYDELEKDGFLDRVPGKGCYVAERNLALEREAHLREAEQALQKAVQLAKPCGVGEDALVAMLRDIWKEECGL